MAAPNRRAQILALLLVVAALLLTPFVWRAVNAAWAPALDDLPPSYLPALEARRAREPFDTFHIGGLQDLQPDYVIVGDSMGGRVDPARMTQLSDEFVVPILYNATGSAFWYLAFKNIVIGSGVRPRWVFVFFRDTNLTDPLWRATEGYRGTLDAAALDDEPELNAVMAARTTGPWYRAHRFVSSAYGLTRARDWLEPALTSWLARVTVGSRNRSRFQDEMNAAFELDALRPISQADMAAAEALDTDFAANVDTSVLPLFLSLAEEHGIRLGFVRVLRRTSGDGEIREQSEALTRYVEDLRTYLEANDAVFFDDRDDPAMATIGYDDGDHILRTELQRYTEVFWARLQRLPE